MLNLEPGMRFYRELAKNQPLVPKQTSYARVISHGQSCAMCCCRACGRRSSRPVGPRALLLDEPLTALDATLRETLRVEISVLLRRLGITSVYAVPGNHDERGAFRAAFADHAHLPAVGFLQFVVDPVGWPVRVIGLDTLVPTDGRGELCDARLAWLAETLWSRRATCCIAGTARGSSAIT